MSVKPIEVIRRIASVETMAEPEPHRVRNPFRELTPPPQYSSSLEELFQSVDQVREYWFNDSIEELHVDEHPVFATSARATNRMTVVNGRDRIVVDLRRHVVCGTEIVRDINLKSVPSDEARWPGRIFKTGPDTPFRAVLMTVDLKRPVRWFSEPDALKKYEAHVKMGTSVMASVARQVHPIVHKCDEWR